MKVLVDSCVWSLALRRKPSVLNPKERRLTALLADAIRDGRVILIGPIRQEVLSGIQSVEQFAKLERHLALFPDEPIEPGDYIQAAQLDSLCRRAGVQCGAIDMLLCAVALRSHWTILTSDSGLLRCIEVIECTLITEEKQTQVRRLSEAVL